MTRFATEQVPAQLLRKGKVLYDVTLDLIIAESEADEPCPGRSPLRA